MSNLTLNHKTGQIYGYATKKELYEFLANLTDEDFNGNNGEDYFIEIETSTGPKLVSKLEACFENYDEEYDEENEVLYKKNFIFSVINSNYSSDNYYKDYDIVVDSILDIITVSVAILES